MRIASPSRLVMVARTDKEARLKDFLGEGLALRTEDPARDDSVTAFLRNPDSPAARALSAVCLDGRAEGACIRVLICDTHADDPAATSVLDISGAEFRVFADPRFGAAHEQLVIGASRVWIGDCMRRDPAKRDAFELYHANDAATRLFAAVSFERLWALGRPIKPARAESVSPEIIAAGHEAGEQGALPRNPRH
jgi:hypothetical protein